ncbi:high affinity cAMP-specific 3',5'-cyclic phosphodiesterase 7A-like isoform X1 [Biomphalaria glabrata]|uniref:Phosphodiesterase n=2 Tax=Biomphalaria glabrata TaxID=6526 RepID=A0A9W3AD92_BIOGL|nr:high affinity cAMP-specific 3',5'-cyclic phosphodiesterase 7A-like isoform X1 [Biomphalaria glabrata]
MIIKIMDSEGQCHRLALDISIPQCALNRRFGISFSSSSSYFVEPRLERRGAVSFPRKDTNAIYIRTLGDVKLRPTSKGEKKVKILSDSDRTMLEKLVPVASHKRTFRSRLMSLTRLQTQHQADTQLSPEARLFVDDFYTSPSRLLLKHLGDWNFNIFRLDVLSGGRPLFQVAYHLFQHYQLIQIFQLEALRLMHFFSLIEKNYHEGNPYHNAIHAADVTQSMHCYLQEPKMSVATTHLEKMAALVAALTHDLDHPGVNNTFLIVTSNPLAALYQNKSVLENHHWRSAVCLLRETGLLNHLPAHQREHFTLLLKSLILATDITRQQEFLLKFSRYIESGEFQYSRNDEHRLFMLQIALKCADISNPCRPWELSQTWSRKICQEFFLQGDTERALNVEVTPLCDRICNTVPNIQYGFMQHVVNPLFKAWDKFLNTELSAQMIQNLNYNQAQWKAMMEKDEDAQEKEDSGEMTDDDQLTSSQVAQPLPEVASQMETDEDSDGKSEEADIVKNDVNLLYHYQNEDKDSDIYLCSLSSGCEPSTLGAPRRYSFPHVVCKDLNYYLGIRKEASNEDSSFFRRQSLPTTALYIHPSLSAVSINMSPRSLSLDTLLGKSKVISLSPSMEADVHHIISLQQPALMLHSGDLTRFTSRRASYDPILVDPSRKNGHLPSDYLFTPLKHQMVQQHSAAITGLASSWPSVSSPQPADLVSELNQLNIGPVSQGHQ